MIATTSVIADRREPDDHAAPNIELPLATVDYSDIDEASIPVLHEAVDAQGFSDADLGSDIDLAMEAGAAIEDVETDNSFQEPSSSHSTPEMKIDLGYVEPDATGATLHQQRVDLQPPRGLSQFIFNFAPVQSGAPQEFNNPGTVTSPAVSANVTENPMPVTHPTTNATSTAAEQTNAAAVTTAAEPPVSLDDSATIPVDEAIELEMTMMHREFHAPDPAPMMPRKENPFLPQHILNRLQGSSRNLVEEIAQSSAALEASTALLRNNKSRAARLAPAAQALAADDRLSLKKQKMIDDLVDDYMPLIAAELRRRLRRMLEE